MPAANSPPRVEAGGFEGPLDLLLEEVRRQKVAIGDLALAPVAARFLEYVRTAQDHNVNLDMEWLHMAAVLVSWKSRSLLPADPAAPPAADPVRDDLVRQLLARRRELAEDLGLRRALASTRFSRAADPDLREPEEEEETPAFVSVFDLIGQAQDLERWVRAYRKDRRYWRETFDVAGEEVTVAEMKEFMRGELTGAEGLPLDGLRLLDGEPSPARRACLFLGMLEMARDRQLDIDQPKAFGPFWLAGCKKEGT
jgi:segregation and condensation protein A